MNSTIVLAVRIISTRTDQVVITVGQWQHLDNVKDAAKAYRSAVENPAADPAERARLRSELFATLDAP